jgi:predicted MFS family arabinose efflux permease
LGALLGGLIIVHFGIHQIIWMSVPLLLVAYSLTFVVGSAPQKDQKIPDETTAQEPVAAVGGYF